MAGKYANSYDHLRRPEQIRRAEDAARRLRWAFPVKARVVHPLHGEIIVPAASKLAAILCASEVWKVSFTEILNSEVWRYEK